MKGINVRLENQDFTKSSKSFLQDLKNSVELPRLNSVFEKNGRLCVVAAYP